MDPFFASLRIRITGAMLRNSPDSCSGEDEIGTGLFQNKGAKQWFAVKGRSAADCLAVPACMQHWDPFAKNLMEWRKSC